MNRRQFLKTNTLVFAGGTVATLNGVMAANNPKAAPAATVVRDISDWFPFEFPLGDTIQLDSDRLSL